MSQNDCYSVPTLLSLRLMFSKNKKFFMMQEIEVKLLN